MNERPDKAEGADPDATVMIPSAAGDPEATIALPRARDADSDATVMMPAPALDPDATIAIPTPGRKREQEAVPPSPIAVAAPESLGGLNPLVGAANPILAVVTQIRHTLRHADPDGLRASLLQRIEDFEGRARAAGIAENSVVLASVALCALIDESAASTPWGVSWAGRGLLAERHGGAAKRDEPLFAALDEQIGLASADPDLLEFLYVCLALGLEGGDSGGAARAGELRLAILERVRRQRAPYDGELSPHWRGIQAPARRPPGVLGVWAAACVAALVLGGMYFGYRISLGSLSDPVAREIAQLRAPMPPVRAGVQAAALPAPGVRERLRTEIARGDVAVSEAPGSSTIEIRSDQLFASGSVRIERSVEPVLRRIAQALDAVRGTIVVTGHTDGVPIRTARFPSNWELSTARAESVAHLMAAWLKDPARLRAEGLADSAPLVPNDSKANRARNRRVEIVLRSTQ